MVDTSTQLSDANHHACRLHCQDEFIGYAARQPVGGVEALRICRERCRDKDSENKPTR